EVPARLPGPLRLARGWAQLLRRLLQLVQRRAPSRRARAVHAARCPLWAGRGEARTTGTRAGRGVRAAAGAVPERAAVTEAAADCGLDQSAEGAHRRRGDRERHDPGAGP